MLQRQQRQHLLQCSAYGDCPCMLRSLPRPASHHGTPPLPNPHPHAGRCTT
jgi:hypothetical protein